MLGLCGGYQMLGRRIHDWQGLEGKPESVDGLGLLDVETTLEPNKALKRISAVHASTSTVITGYEIHLGRTSGSDCARPFAFIDAVPDGAISRDGRVAGTYIHGCFESDPFARLILPRWAARRDRLAMPSGSSTRWTLWPAISPPIWMSTGCSLSRQHALMRLDAVHHADDCLCGLGDRATGRLSQDHSRGDRSSGRMDRRGDRRLRGGT